MTEEEIRNLNEQEVFEELERQFGDDALESRGSYTQGFELEIERRKLQHEYVLYIASLLGLPDVISEWDESDAWQFLNADLSTRIRAALLASHILE